MLISKSRQLLPRFEPSPGQTTNVPYADVQKIRGAGLSKGDKILIGVGVGVAVTVLVLYLAVVRNID